MKLTRVGVDLAKQVFQVHGVDRAERPIWCQRLKRGRRIAEFDTAPGRPFFPAMRFYGPEKPLFDKTWKLPDLEKTN
jgi:hypothetical protein